MASVTRDIVGDPYVYREIKRVLETRPGLRKYKNLGWTEDDVPTKDWTSFFTKGYMISLNFDNGTKILPPTMAYKVIGNDIEGVAGTVWLLESIIRDYTEDSPN